MKYFIVGYGSLISHNSLKETINDKKYELVIVRGYKRIFNIFNGWRKDILNLKKSSNSKFNGVIFEVDDEELRKIKKREDIYKFEEVEVYGFKSRKKIRKAFIVIDYFIDIDKEKKLPSKNYFVLCREAAYHISRKFGNYWDKTTYISDNERISEWIKKHREYDTIER